ncbi:MAG: DUF134 domain-containing protein [Firmicutes bacterium]|nr:DUF134 domain-containing protein [Bacillota bacterium]
MPRPPKTRKVGFIPTATYFKPAGVPMSKLEEIQLGIDELEALRLKDVLGMDQEECARQMDLTQSTFQRIITAARQKVASAIVEGKALRVEGGKYQFVLSWVCRSCGQTWEEAGPEKDRITRCPSCKGVEVDNQRAHSKGPGPPPWAGAGRGRRRGIKEVEE